MQENAKDVLSVADNIQTIYYKYYDKTINRYLFYQHFLNAEVIALYINNLIDHGDIDIPELEATRKIFKDRKEELEKNNKPVLQTLSEKVYTDLYTEFQIYLHNILNYIYKTNKKLLVNNIKEKIDADNINSKEIDMVVTKIIKSKSCVDILRKIYKENKIEFNISKEEKNNLIKISCKRNLIIHNNGIVNSEYIKIFNKNNIELDYKEGQNISENISEHIFTDNEIMIKLGGKLCEVLKNKYKDFKNS